MKEEKGVIIAAFDEKGRVLVLKRKKNWEGWELPKGHLEQNNYEETVLTEMEEEAGIEPEKIDSIQDLEETITWEYDSEGEEHQREYKAFKVNTSNVEAVDTSNNPSEEHEHGFFLRPRHVKEMLEYEDNKKVLDIAMQQN